MKTKFINNEFIYDGTQLRSLYAYLEHGLLGDSVVSWVGPCNVAFAEMVDGEDLLAKSEIRGARMLHFIVEIFNQSLFSAVALQRLFAAIGLDLLRAFAPAHAAQLKREGDDLYFGDGKLSISIATVSPSSALIHFAINCTNDGTPVKTAALSDLGVEPRAFADRAMAALAAELSGVSEATMKVRWVR